MSTLKMRERCRKPGLKYYRTHLDRSWLGSFSTFKTLWTRTTPGEVTDDTRRASGVKCCLLIGLHLDCARLPIGCRAFATNLRNIEERRRRRFRSCAIENNHEFSGRESYASYVNVNAHRLTSSSCVCGSFYLDSDWLRSPRAPPPSCTGLTEAPPSSGLNKQKQIRRSHHVSVKGAGHLLQSGPITRASDSAYVWEQLPVTQTAHVKGAVRNIN